VGVGVGVGVGVRRVGGWLWLCERVVLFEEWIALVTNSEDEMETSDHG